MAGASRSGLFFARQTSFRTYKEIAAYTAFRARPSRAWSPTIWVTCGGCWPCPSESRHGADQFAARAGENRRPVGQACPVLSAASGGKLSDAAVVRKHGVADRGAVPVPVG